ncbi:MAG: hypothetical protein RMJ14_03305 [Nitrososphaerota archaeon]|nr:hypothetical protein [Nitrososphaerota archaeon]
MTAVTITVGLFVWGIVGGWAGTSAINMVRETNKGVAQQRSLLIVELVDQGSGTVWVSNPGKTDLVVLSCVIYPKLSSPPPKTYQKLAEVRASMNNYYPLRIGSECQLVGSGPYVIEITAIASTLYNEKNPVENVQWAIVVRQDV